MTGKDQNFTVAAATTLLPFLLEQVRGKSHNNVKSILARGQARVDGACVTKYDFPLAPGQTVTVTAAPPPADKLPFPILFEDENLVVIDKPAGLLSIATDEEKDETAYHMLTDYVRSVHPSSRIYVVHRLDRDTSGVLLFAKNETTKQAFQDQWEEIILKRGYTAVVEGVPQEREGVVHSWLRETKSHLVYSGQGKDGKEAITRYRVLKDNGRYSLMDVQLETGRKNQIRVHMKDLGCPVAGDRKYGAHTRPLSRLCLHASELRFRHPLTGEETAYIAPAPATFRTLVRS